MKPSFFFLALIGLAGCISQERVATYTIAPRPTSVTIPATEIRTLLGTRWAVAGALEDIFGADSVLVASPLKKVSDVTRSHVIQQPVSWGGSCDPYAAAYEEPRDVGWAIWPAPAPGYVPPARACEETKTSKETMLPGGSTSRLAWTIRACDYFTSVDAPLKVAVTNAGGSAAAINTPPTDAQIANAYDMFHPGAPLPPEVAAALKQLVSEAASKYANSPEAWRFLIFTLCSSPSWQIL